VKEQDQGAFILDSCTKHKCPMILCVKTSHVINLIAFSAVTTYNSVMFCSNYTHYITIISIMFTIIPIISKLKIAIGCVFIAENMPNGTFTTGNDNIREEKYGLNHQEPRRPVQWRVLRQLSFE
jgi:hypothetical protein